MTFDLYLLRSFAHVFGVCLISFYGLVVVIDLLENIDDFLMRQSGNGTLALIGSITQYYFLQGIFFLDRAGPSLTAVSAMVVLILFQRTGELHSMLAAGVPMYRVLAPIPIASLAISLLLAMNRECVIPQFAHAALQERGSEGTDYRVESVYDHSTRISIDGKQLDLKTRTVRNAEFILPVPSLVREPRILKAKKAVFTAASKVHPAGWILYEPSHTRDELELTPEGERLIRTLRGQQPRLFVASAVSCDHLYKRNSSYSLLSSAEILERIHCPAYGALSIQRLTLHLHQRLVQPLMNVVAVLVAMPLLVRKESTGLVVDAAWCLLAQGTLFGLMQGCEFLGSSQVLSCDLAAWLPVVAGATLAAWLGGALRT